jgi:hypothetical protein
MPNRYASLLFICPFVSVQPNVSLVNCKRIPLALTLGTPTRAGANCPNRGPPIFATASVKGSLKIEGDPNDVDAIIASLAATLGVDPALIVLDGPVSGRRAALEVSFTIAADPNQIEGLMNALEDPGLVESMASSLAAMGVNATVTPGKPTKEIPKRREGEVWEMRETGDNAGKYILTACYKGSLLVNTTLDTQVTASGVGFGSQVGPLVREECKTCDIP